MPVDRDPVDRDPVDHEIDDQPFTPLSIATAWTEQREVPAGSRSRSRQMRHGLWTAGIAVTVIMLGVALYAGRHGVMRTFRGIYAAPGMTSIRSAADTAVSPRSP